MRMRGGLVEQATSGHHEDVVLWCVLLWCGVVGSVDEYVGGLLDILDAVVDAVCQQKGCCQVVTGPELAW